VRLRFRLLGWNVRFMSPVSRPENPAAPDGLAVSGQRANSTGFRPFLSTRDTRRAAAALVSKASVVIALAGSGDGCFPAPWPPETKAFPQVLKSLCKKGFVDRAAGSDRALEV
jgi:hypothetical protein